MIKVLHIGLSKNPGGVENQIFNYFKNIDRNEFHFGFFDLYGEGIAFQKEIESIGGEIFSTINYKKAPIRLIKDLLSLIKKEKYDILHFHMQSTANILPILVGKYCKIIVIGHSHSSSVPNGIIRKLLNSVNRKFLYYVNLTKWACSICAGTWMWQDRFKNQDVIVNAIDESIFKMNYSVRNRIRAEYGIKEEDRVLGFVGRFGCEKNVFYLIKILKKLINKKERYILFTVGGNDCYNEFEKKIYSENLSNRHISVGVKQSTVDYYKAMDVFLLPSFFEGFPVVALEAQATGLPCLLSNKISSEVKLTDNLMFLPIDGDDTVDIWIERIERLFDKRGSFIVNFPSKYSISYATRILEERYIELLEGKIR